jgi:pyruvate dehydrogenase E2 component (dihydrolipoamide acetyltransferase)
MPTVIMPKMGDAMEEGTLLRWLKQVGDNVNAGDPIAEIETDKVTLEIEAADSGVLSKTLAPEGSVVPIGQAIAVIGEDDGTAEAAAAPAPEAAAAPAPAAEAAPAPAPVAAAAPVAAPAAPPTAPAAATNGHAAGSGERLRASPLVKRLAAEHGIDLAAISGTGPGGRIIRDDIAPYLTGAKPLPAAAPAEATPAPAAAAAPAAAPRPGAVVTDLSRIKKTTGKRMIESKLAAPHFYVTTDIDMGAAVAFRKQINAGVDEDGVKVSFNDMVVKAAALALREFPNLNSSLENDQLHTHPNIDVNIAVALPEGLIAPFIPGADEKSLGTVARMAKDLIGRARNGGLQPNEYQGGTFTVSNLGMYEVDEFISIINPPQAAILAVGSIAEAPVVKDGKVVPGHRMKVTLSADHRVTDGAEVARFLQIVKRLLENPMRLAVG